MQTMLFNLITLLISCCCVLSAPECVQREAEAGGGRSAADAGARGAAHGTPSSQRQGQEICMWGTEWHRHTHTHTALRGAECDAVLPLCCRRRVCWRSCVWSRSTSCIWSASRRAWSSRWRTWAADWRKLSRWPWREGRRSFRSWRDG